MSTYAVWWLWVGSRINLLYTGGTTEDTLKILDSIQGGEPWQTDGLILSAIPMHGEIVGIGVQVALIGWSTQISDGNIFDPGLIKRAEEVKSDLDKVFKRLGLGTPTHIFHHIDLGG